MVQLSAHVLLKISFHVQKCVSYQRVGKKLPGIGEAKYELKNPGMIVQLYNGSGKYNSTFRYSLQPVKAYVQTPVHVTLQITMNYCLNSWTSYVV